MSSSMIMIGPFLFIAYTFYASSNSLMLKKKRAVLNCPFSQVLTHYGRNNESTDLNKKLETNKSKKSKYQEIKILKREKELTPCGVKIGLLFQ